jgi:hypothetical protein
MNSLQSIFKLTIVTVFITLALFAFTLANKSEIDGPGMLYCGVVSTGVGASSIVPLQHPGLKLFEDNCKACHRLDQKLVGPALRYSFVSSDSVWFVKMIISANALISAGDTLALQLFNDFNQIQHPDFKGFNETELASLVEYLKLEGLRNDLIVP